MKSKKTTIDYFDTEKNEQKLKSKAIIGVGATLFAQGTNFIIGFASTIILARILTPNDFGLLGMVMVFSLLFQNFGLRGFTEVTIQQDNIHHKMVSTIFWLHLFLSILASLIFIGISPFITWFYDEPRLQKICLAIPLTFIFTAFYTQHLALLRRKMQFYRETGCRIFSASISSLLAIVLALKGWGVWALVVRRVFEALFLAIPAWLFCRWVPGLPGKITGLGNIIKFALNTYGNFCVNYCSRHLDYLLIGWRHGTVSLGNYQKAYDLFALPANQLTYPLTNVFVSVLSRYRTDPERFRNFYLKSLGLLAFVAMPISPMLTISGKEIIYLLLGPQWTEAGHIFSAFGISIGIMVVYGTHGWLHLSLGTPNMWFKWGIIEFFTTATLFLIGLPFGAIGVACGWSASYYLLFIPGLWISGKSIDLKAMDYVKSVWKYFLSSLVAGLGTWAVFNQWGPGIGFYADTGHFMKIIISTILCGIIYLLLVIILHRGIGPVLDLIRIAKEMIPSKKRRKEADNDK